MKKLLLSLLCLSFAFATQAQFFPGMFYHDLGSTTSSSPCVLDSSFYVIRYAGVERFTSGSQSVDYLWNRFYPVSEIVRGPSHDILLIKNGMVHRYFPSTDSMVNISGSLSPTVRDVAAATYAIWAAFGFDEIARYDSLGWQTINLSTSASITHILPISDTSAYLTDNTNVWLYTPSGLSSSMYGFGTSGAFTEWVADTAGNAWMVVNGSVVKLAHGSASTFNQSNTGLPAGNNFTHLTVAHGVVLASTDYGDIFGYDGTTLQSYNIHLTSIESMTADPQSHTVYLHANGDSIVTYNDSTNHIRQYYFDNMPYQKIQAVSPAFIATDQGLFYYGTNLYPYLSPRAFKDSSMTPFANDVTCFVVNNQNIDSGYGTHHGVYNTTIPINNASLPDTNINYLYYALGSYYIGTNKGLCIYNQVVYTNFDTSNSALPSNKITFVISYQSPYTSAQELWVGTDKGLALYTNGQWTRFDTSTIHTSDFYVTGILPCPYYYMNADSTVWVSTLGQGLVKVKRNGNFSLYNTSNGKFRDDSLYYVIQTYGCEYVGSAIIGTAQHGFASIDIPSESFYYVNVAYNNSNGQADTFSRSDRYAMTGGYWGQTLLTTDQGIDFLSRCGGVGISEIQQESDLSWYQMDDHELLVRLPAEFAGNASFELYDMMGRNVLHTSMVPADRKANMDISALSAGVYVLRVSDANTGAQTKIIISK